MGKAVYGFADIDKILASREADDDSSSVIEQAMIEHFRDINRFARPPWGGERWLQMKHQRATWRRKEEYAKG